jgi:hypothetical protein
VNPNAIARNGRDREIVPDLYRAFALNRGRLTAGARDRAARRRRSGPGNSKIRISLPLPSGGYGNVPASSSRR